MDPPSEVSRMSFEPEGEKEFALALFSGMGSNSIGTNATKRERGRGELR